MSGRAYVALLAVLLLEGVALVALVIACGAL